MLLLFLSFSAPGDMLPGGFDFKEISQQNSERDFQKELYSSAMN